MKINVNYKDFTASYLFSDIAKRVKEFKENNPEAQVISLGIGDVTQPLTPSVLKALHKAVDEMGVAESFKGYGPEQGYAFLRETIAKHAYLDRGIQVSAEDIFVSDGTKSDIGNFQELFGADCRIAVTDPVYPVYVDSNAMSGRAGKWTGSQWSNIIYLPCTKENDFVPELPKEVPNCIYLCYPNNPTGSVLTKEQLKVWVDYAKANKSIILYDAAYEAYIQDPSLPHSIYEIEGADEVAVEFRSFSKTAGFTGLRCGYVVVPKKVVGYDDEGNTFSLKDMWNRRQTTKFNGCPYIVQKAAEAIYSPEGQEEIQALVKGYMANAQKILATLKDMGLQACGGEHAPYIWITTPNNMPSWDFFQLLLDKAHVVSTPGMGFGLSGEGYVRLTAFANSKNVDEALKRIAKVLA